VVLERWERVASFSNLARLRVKVRLFCFWGFRRVFFGFAIRSRFRDDGYIVVVKNLDATFLSPSESPCTELGNRPVHVFRGASETQRWCHMTKVIPNLELDIGGFVLLQQSLSFWGQSFFWGRIFFRVGTFVSQVYLLIS
jgi:hypothetical protein